MSIYLKFVTTLAALVLFSALATNVMAKETKRSIKKIAGDVYYFQNDFHLSLVTVTDEGAVIVDPINAEASEWLKDNLSTITNQPITHLIYSHSHDDHASGGEIYVEAGAKVIAQANAPDAIYGVIPDLLFGDTMIMRLGGKTFELTYLGEGHGKDLIAVVVRPENIAFITDAVSTKSIPYLGTPGTDLDGWLNQIKKIETLNFDILAPAHSSLGNMADVTDVRKYFETLREQVLRGLKDGKSVDTLVSSITMEEYNDWAQYVWQADNVRAMVSFLQKSSQVH